MDNEPQPESWDELHERLKRETAPFFFWLDLIVIPWGLLLALRGAVALAHGLTPYGQKNRTGWKDEACSLD